MAIIDDAVQKKCERITSEKLSSLAEEIFSVEEKIRRLDSRGERVLLRDYPLKYLELYAKSARLKHSVNEAIRNHHFKCPCCGQLYQLRQLKFMESFSCGAQSGAALFLDCPNRKELNTLHLVGLLEDLQPILRYASVLPQGIFLGEKTEKFSL